MKCFYHSADLDGHCSGAIVKKAHPECELIGINYGNPFPWDSIKHKEPVYMVDFCLQPFEEMAKLWMSCDLIWIDHHKTTIEESILPEYEVCSIRGKRRVGKAACELTWEYLMPKPMPKAVFYLGRYDVWDLEANPNVLPFQFGMRAYETDPAKMNPDNNIWQCVLCSKPEIQDKHISRVIDQGRTILKYRNQENQKYLDACAFETEFEGHKAICMNRGLTNSQCFDHGFDPDKHDLMITFCRRPNRIWTVSLYSTKEHIDVGAIAKKYGGGGHKGAAGFQCTEIPFTY